MVYIKDLMGKMCYDQLSNTYQYQTVGAMCERCLKGFFVPDMVFLRITWKKVHSKAEFLCHPCMLRFPVLKDTFEVKALFLVEQLEPKSLMYAPTPPVLTATKTMNETIYGNTEAEIIDNTRYSGREGYTFNISDSEKRTSLPISEFQPDYIETKDDEMGLDEAFDLLETTKQSTLLTAEGNKILLIEEEEKD